MLWLYFSTKMKWSIVLVLANILVGFCTEERKSQVQRPEDDLLTSFSEIRSLQRNVDVSPDSGLDPTVDSYILAYNLEHENHQNSEGDRTLVKKISKRSTPELIKFELSDAKEPDDATKEFLRLQREQRERNLSNTSENSPSMTPTPPSTKPSTKTSPSSSSSSGKRTTTRRGRKQRKQNNNEDQVINESRQIKLIHPITKLKPVYGSEKLPIEVQKIIDMVIQEKGMYKDQAIIRYGAAPLTGHKYAFGEKTLKQYDNLYSKFYGSNLKGNEGKSEGLKTKPQETDSQQLKYSAAYIPLSEAKFKEITSKSISPGISKAEHFGEPLHLIQVSPNINYVVKDGSVAPIQPSSLLPNSHMAVHITPAPKLEALTYKQHPSYPKSNHDSSAGLGSYRHVPNLKSEGSDLSEQIYRYGGKTELGGAESENAFKLQYANLGDFEKQIISEHHLFQESSDLLSGKVSEDGSNLNALSALVGKDPSDQLQGLKYLLTQEIIEHPHAAKQQQQRPQDNTSPILFHPDRSLPGSGASQPGQSSAGGIAGFKDNSGHFGVTSLPLGYTYQAKEYTPITESPEEVSPAPGKHSGEHVPIIHVTPPPPTSYNQIHTLSPNYEGLLHDEALQYASKYAFGYRVRDFHTGNDFSHTQKRDGDGITRGEYHILLPDGRVQNVRYHADDSGFHAEVSYETGH